MLRASPASPAGFLRCYSRSSIHPTAGDALVTPLLELTILGERDTTVTLEAAADAYTIGPLAPPAALPDSVLWLGAGCVRRTAIHIDPAPLLVAPTWSGREAPALLRGVLRLHLAPGGDWSLARGGTLNLYAYEAEIDWAAADPIREATLVAKLAEVTVAAEDSVLEIPIADHLRRRIEGVERSLLLLCAPEVGVANAVLFKSPSARVGPPEVEVTLGTVDGRWGR